MKAIVTSIGEPTTDLCKWALERQGFEVRVYEDRTTLADKLQRIYSDLDEDFVRVDADVIVNRHIKKLLRYDNEAWWVQGQCYGWFSQDLIYGGVQFICKAALPSLRFNITSNLNKSRPETEMFRLAEFHNPRKCISADIVCGIHGWGQHDIKRVKAIKAERNQLANYDFELAERMDRFEG